MSEYIEREALMRNLKQFAYEQLTPLVESLIQKHPAADVVEVVRCKNCKNYNTNNCADGFGWCEKYYYYDTFDESFCSYGERKEGDYNA